MIRKQQLCEICADEVSYLDYLSQKDSGNMVCRSYDCKRLIQQKQTLAPALFDAQLRFHKDRLRDRIEKQAEEKARLEALSLAQSTENRRIRRAFLDNNPQCPADNLYTLPIPSGISRLTELSEQRKARYRDHLQEVIDQALSYSDAAAVPRDAYHGFTEALTESQQRLATHHELRAVSDSVCGLCKGGCCCNGADAAYISVLTVRTYMDSNPGMSGNDVLASYLGKLGSYSTDDACINQTSSGCALPRDMRSDICNAYYCDTLKAYQAQACSSGELAQILVIQRSNTNWMQLAATPQNRVVATALVTPGQAEILATQSPDPDSNTRGNTDLSQEQEERGIP